MYSSLTCPTILAALVLAAGTNMRPRAIVLRIEIFPNTNTVNPNILADKIL